MTANNDSCNVQSYGTRLAWPPAISGNIDFSAVGLIQPAKLCPHKFQNTKGELYAGDQLETVKPKQPKMLLTPDQKQAA
jgi:hypothetical protein